MERLVERRDYKMAAKIADGIDWRRVRNVELLMTVSEIYERLERYEDSYEILNMAYDRASIGRPIVYKMAELATYMGDFDEAIELYKEFVKIAPHDLSRYVLKYKIYQAKGAPVSDQIAILEEFKSREYHEKWAYELAVLYYKEGMNAKCVEECDDLILWFSEGEYVRRALELKMRIQPLTASQEEKYRNLMRMSGTIDIPDEIIAQAKARAQMNEDAVDGDGAAQASQAEGAKAEKKAAIDVQSAEENSHFREPADQEEYEAQSLGQKDDIQVRTVNPDERYNTINLQAELAAGMKDLFDQENASKAEPVKVETPAAVSAPVSAPKTGGSLHLGQREDGQITFNDEENVLDRQITGQMTIDEILAEWEVKKKQMEARLARLAEEEKARKEAEALRRQQEEEERQRQEELLRQEQAQAAFAEAAAVRSSAGRSLAASTNGTSLIPPDVQKILDEIEGKLPVKIIVEPIERTEPVFLRDVQEVCETAKEEPGESAEEAATEELEKTPDEAVAEELEKAAEEKWGESADETVEESQEEPTGEDAAEKLVQDTDESEAMELPEEIAGESEEVVLTSVPETSEAPLPDIESEVEDDLPQELDEIEAILTAALQEELEEAQAAEAKRNEKATQSKTPESQPKAAFKKEEPASNMIQDLERMLEKELKNVHGQHLTEEQEKLFAYFTAVHGMNQQLSQFLEEDRHREKDGTSIAGNLVVTGESGTGKTTLAIDMVKAVQKQRRAKGSKMAKVTGEALSQKDVGAVVRKMNGGALVIERAGGLTTEAAAMLSGAMLGETGNLFVILEDEPAEIKRLFERCESLAAKFARTIEIPVFTNNELVAFGKSYAGEQGFVLDEMAVLALYNRIGNNQTSDHLVNVAEVKEMIDEAVLNASRKGVKKLFGKRRQDEFGNYVLLEKDFEV